MMRTILEININLPFTYSFMPWIIYFFYLYINKKTLSATPFLISVLFLYLGIISSIYYENDIMSLYRFLYNSLLPILILYISLHSIEHKYLIFVKIINVIVIVNTLYGFIDFVSGKTLQLVLSDLLTGSHYENSINNDIKSNVYRLFSPFGHPLVNMGLSLIFIVSNIILVHYKDQKAYISFKIVLLISICNGFLINSKFGLICLALILLSLIFFTRRKILNLIVLSIASLIAINSSFFKENIIKRFSIAIERGDISNGRLAALEYVFNDILVKPFYFIGGGMGYSDELLRSVSNFNNIEIPLVMYMFDYGIVISILIIGISYIVPAATFIKNGTYYLFFLYSIIFLFFNSFNGLAVNIGLLLILNFFAMVLMNLSNDIRRKKNA
ncbi:hypothetical protein [Jeotgalibacillus proteolyticus]|uniref:hypothetical protein n=1 Tax=Jeotgalibacillus proteolyticus TaxID=2082395 RepID=UPI003CE721C1